MPDKGLFLQNVIAIIWDFDKTLTPEYMQAPIFREYDINAREFWNEVNALPAYYARAGIHVAPDTSYLGHLLTYVKQGRMPGLSNAKLRELGGRLTFYPGIPELFTRLAAILGQPAYRDGDLRLENYVVSTGIAEIIRGSGIAPHLSGIWASEFIETPAQPGENLESAPRSGEISQIAGFLDNTTKTRAIFEINKGVNKLSEITVNDLIPEEERRVPIRNMIYVADGPSDIPSFSVIRKHGGLAYAVYDPDSEERFRQADRLREQGRVDAYGPCDYSKGGQTDMWLRLQVENIAGRIMAGRKRALESKLGSGPTHIHDEEDDN